MCHLCVLMLSRPNPCDGQPDPLWRCGERRDAPHRRIEGWSYLSDFVLAHAVCHIVLVLEDEKRSTHEALLDCQQWN